MVVAKRVYSAMPEISRHQQQQSPRPVPRHKQRVAGQVAAGLLILALALLVVFRYGLITGNNLEIRRMQNTYSALVDEQNHMEITIAQLTSLDRLERIARLDLGLSEPQPEQIRYIDE